MLKKLLVLQTALVEKLRRKSRTQKFFSLFPSNFLFSYWLLIACSLVCASCVQDEKQKKLLEARSIKLLGYVTSLFFFLLFYFIVVSNICKITSS